MASALFRSKQDSGSFLEPTCKYESSLMEDDPKISSYGENKYLTRPLVYYRKHQMVINELLHQPADRFKNKAEDTDVDAEVNNKIQKTLKLLTLRDPCNLIQFWSPYSAGKSKLLKTVDQPFGLGIHDEKLCNYRKESEKKCFPVDEMCKVEDLIPVVRVFMQRLPEWTSDVTNYYSKNHPLRDCAIRWNLHGYLVLPVFDSHTMSCVGVLESITSSRYVDCAYEVKEVHRTLMEAKLTSPQAFDCPASYVGRGFRNPQHELDEIFKILKDCCLTHKLPLAQTWKVSSTSSFVATKQNIEMTCSSFSSSCIGEVCLSTTGLPFYVHDLSFWHFREACREHHLIKSEGVVGRALSSHGSCFCADVKQLEEDEYSLVHDARMSGLTSCLAIYLHSKEQDDSYVLEFFLPVDMKESADQQNLVQKLKLHIESSSFAFKNLLVTEVIELPMEVSQQSLALQLHSIQTSLSKDSQIVWAQNDCVNALDQPSFSNQFPKNSSGTITNTEGVGLDDATRKNIDLVTGGKGFNSEEKDAPRERKRQYNLIAKVQLDSEFVEKTNAQTGCRNAQDQHDVYKGYHKNCSSDIASAIDVVIGEKRARTKHRRKRKMDCVTPENIKKYFGKPMEEASKRLGVSRSTLKRVCREINIRSWPIPNRNKKTVHFGIYVAVFLLVRLKRWSCSSNHHGFSAKWWICGKHSFVSTLNPPPEGEIIRGLLSSSQPSQDPNKSIETLAPFSNPPGACFGIYDAASLLLRLKRWRKRTIIHHTMVHNDYQLVDDHQISNTSSSVVFYESASPKMNVIKVSDSCRMVTVKATYKDDMIKFRIPVSSGLLGLENQVAQRFKLKNTRLHLKYRDEDDDLILIACDADFYNLVSFSGASSNHTIKLFVHVAVNY